MFRTDSRGSEGGQGFAACLSEIIKEDKIRTCYLYTCYCYVNEIELSNAVLRERFGVLEKNKAIVSRIIKDTVDKGLIKTENEAVGIRARRYVLYWG